MSDVDLSNSIRNGNPLTSRSIKLKRLIFDDFVNDADYVVSPRIDGKQLRCPAYAKWISMVFRCNHPSCLSKRPEYVGVTICDEWKSFMNFRSWWEKNCIDGYHLDKDLLVAGNKEYSPAACVFIPPWLNTFLCDQKARRGDYSIGVSFCSRRGKYIAECRDPIRKVGSTVGRFGTEKEANHAYVDRKLQHLKSLKENIDEINTKIYSVAFEIISSRRI